MWAPARLGLRLGPQGLYEALRNFGFGSKSGIDLPGEIIGLVRDWRDWSGLSIGAISFGQEVGVTSIQILTAINAIANSGYRIRPSIVDRIIDENGDLVFARTPERTRLMSPRTAEAVSNAFEGVVLRGTGKRAALEGYRAAGKTGTAQKIVEGQYSDSKYVSSFIGFAPLPQPKITVLVQIDEPKGSHYGGDVSAPFFQKIAQETLMQLKIPPDQSLPLPKIAPLTVDAGSEDYLPNATPVQPLQSMAQIQSGEEPQEIISVPVGGELVVLPDFRGMAKQKSFGQVHRSPHPFAVQWLRSSRISMASTGKQNTNRISVQCDVCKRNRERTVVCSRGKPCDATFRCAAVGKRSPLGSKNADRLGHPCF